jgi:hypothetical protein
MEDRWISGARRVNGDRKNGMGLGRRGLQQVKRSLEWTVALENS